MLQAKDASSLALNENSAASGSGYAADRVVLGGVSSSAVVDGLVVGVGDPVLRGRDSSLGFGGTDGLASLVGELVGEGVGDGPDEGVADGVSLGTGVGPSNSARGSVGCDPSAVGAGDSALGAEGSSVRDATPAQPPIASVR
ncbi:MAG: hypothetical protein ACRDO4_04390, partial [Nocardioides sp.]